MPLSTIDQQSEEIGDLAAKLALKLIVAKTRAEAEIGADRAALDRPRIQFAGPDAGPSENVKVNVVY